MANAGAQMVGAVASLADVPNEIEWLSDEETTFFRNFRISKRADDWRLGRYAAKRLLHHRYFESYYLRDFSILPSETGAPQVHHESTSPCPSVSISHRDGMCFAMCADLTVAFGCDLEKIEPRTGLFVDDYFTESESAFYRSVPRFHQPLAANLIWSCKESVLKAIQTGLRADTRSIETKFDLANVVSDTSKTWHPFTAESRDAIWFGMWFLMDGFVFTVAANVEPPVAQIFRVVQQDLIPLPLQ